MGRLDDHAKKQIVELRKAGLSFRKIKKVLELDNIRVTPQAIYLFLKRKNVEPALSLPSSQQQPALEKESKRTVIDQAGWDNDRLWNLLQENGAGQHQPRQSGDHGTPHPTLGASRSCEGPFSNTNQDSPRIVHVTSLSKDRGPFEKPNATYGALSTGTQLGPSLGKALHNCLFLCFLPLYPAVLPNRDPKWLVTVYLVAAIFLGLHIYPHFYPF